MKFPNAVNGYLCANGIICRYPKNSKQHYRTIYFFHDSLFCLFLSTNITIFAYHIVFLVIAIYIILTTRWIATETIDTLARHRHAPTWHAVAATLLRQRYVAMLPPRMSKTPQNVFKAQTFHSFYVNYKQLAWHSLLHTNRNCYLCRIQTEPWPRLKSPAPGHRQRLCRIQACRRAAQHNEHNRQWKPKDNCSLWPSTPPLPPGAR